MQNSKTVKLIKPLSKGKLEGIILFLNNPQFNNNDAVKKIYEFIHKYSGNNFSSRKLTNENAYAYAHPNTSFSQKKFNNLLNKLNDKIRIYISILEVIKDEVDLELKFLEFLLYNKELFENQYNRVSKKLSKANLTTHDSLSATFKLQQIYTSHKAIFPSQQDRNLMELNESLNQLNNKLDEQYIASKLIIYCDMLNGAIIKEHKYNFSEIKHILHLFDSKSKEYTYLRPWKETIRLLLKIKNKEPITKEECIVHKDLIIHQCMDYPLVDLGNLITYLITLWNRFLKIGMEDFSIETEASYSENIFEIIEFRLKKGFYLHNGQIPLNSVKNIVTAALRVGKVVWLEEFYHHYGDSFQQGYQEEIKNFVKAKLLFEKKAYKKVIEHLNFISIKNEWFNLSCRVSKLKAYYELENDEFEFEVSRLRKYLFDYSRRNEKNLN